MKYCPLCASEYREGRDQCATCGATLVADLTGEVVRANPPRLLWIGGTSAEFDAVAGALREAGIPALAEEGPGKIVPKFLRSESQICVLQNDFPRALEIADREIAGLPNSHELMEKCHNCGVDCSASLTVCPKCHTTLIMEREVRQIPSQDQQFSVSSTAKYCPTCGTIYLESYQHCSKCGIKLVPEVMRGKPLSERDLQDKIVLVWRGGDPVALSQVVSVLRETGIRHHVEATHDYLVFGLAMPRPKYMVRVLLSDSERAKELLADIADSPFFGSEVSPDFPSEIPAGTRRVAGHWNSAAAIVEIWAGDDGAMCQILEDCLRENQIGFRREGKPPEMLQLLVTKDDEPGAREILREVIEGNPTV